MWPAREETGEAAAPCERCRRSALQPAQRGTHTCGHGRAGPGPQEFSLQSNTQV